MHSVFHGVVKSLFHYWFELEGEFSLKAHKEEINKRLLSIQPPSFVQTAPRSIDDWKNWRAHEFLHFILFYAFPVFYKLMDSKYLNHLKYLIIPLEVLSMRVIRRSDLKVVEELLFKFVLDVETLYSELILKSGMHELVHLADMTLDFGPLNITCLFQYEEINRKILRLVHGFDLIGEEFIKVFSISQRLRLISEVYIKEETVKNFLDKYCKIKTCNRKKISYSGVSYIENNRVPYSEISILNLIRDYDKTYNESEQAYVLQRITYNQLCFTSFHPEFDKNRFGNYCVYDKMSKNQGFILKFIIANKKTYLVCRKLVTLNSFYCVKNSTLKSKLFVSSLSKDIFITEIQFVSHLFFFKLTDKNFLISTLNTNHLFK